MPPELQQMPESWENRMQYLGGDAERHGNSSGVNADRHWPSSAHMQHKDMRECLPLHGEMHRREMSDERRFHDRQEIYQRHPPALFPERHHHTELPPKAFEGNMPRGRELHVTGNRNDITRPQNELTLLEELNEKTADTRHSNHHPRSHHGPHTETSRPLKIDKTQHEKVSQSQITPVLPPQLLSPAIPSRPERKVEPPQQVMLPEPTCLTKQRIHSTPHIMAKQVGGLLDPSKRQHNRYLASIEAQS